MKLNLKKLYIAIGATILLIIAAVLLFQSGLMNKAPHVTAVPDNCYEKTLTVITDEDYSPYSFYDTEHNPSGHDVELIIMIANEMKVNLELRLMNWYEGIDAIRAGEGDVLMTCDYSDTFEGVDSLVKCEPVSFDDFIVYSKNRIDSSDELYGKRIAIMRNGNVTAQIDMMNLNRFCLEYENNRMAMQALINDEADCAIMRQTVGTVLLKELNAKGIDGYIGIGQSFMCFGVAEGDEELVDGINAAIETLKMNGEMNRLHNKWLTTFIRPYTFGEILHNNPWVMAVIIVLIATALLIFIISYRNKRKSEEEQHLKDLAVQKQLEDARDAAEAANDSKTRFLFNMSHDIRTPMNAITGFTGMAIKHIDDKEKVLDCLNKTQKAGGMLLSLINSVLEVSRIESGNVMLEEQPLDIYRSFSDIDNTLLELAKMKDINLSFEFGEVKNRYVYADFTRCMRIFVNIISNAIKYTGEGGSVTVKCEQKDDPKDGYASYLYTFTDNGIGMSDEFQKHIYDQFARETTATISGIQGTGLGMTVVRSLVDLLGGTIDFTSRQGEGTVFKVTLPFRLQEQESENNSASETDISSGKISFAGRRVLLVEDNALNREIAIDILSEEGLTVEEAEDGTVAVEMLKEKGADYYDFVLMDIQMPLMNGYDATRKIREMYPGSKLPVIALSANAFSEDKEASIAAGMNAHVAKPINISELMNVLEVHLKKKV